MSGSEFFKSKNLATDSLNVKLRIRELKKNKKNRSQNQYQKLLQNIFNAKVKDKKGLYS